MAEEILASVVAELLNALTVQVAKQINLAWGVDKDLKKLQTSLSRIQDLLQDADENQQAKHKQVGEWLERLKDFAYDAEDVMDKFSYADLRWRLEIQNRLMATMRNFFSRSNPVAFRLKMAHKIKDINAAFDEIVEEMEKFGIIKKNIIIPHDKLAAPARETTSTVTLSDIVGRKEDKEMLVDMLLIDPSEEDDLPISIIPIVGIGGLGKTTLAQLVYNDVRVQTHFTGPKMWVCVSEDFNVKKLIGDIIESAGEKRPDSTSRLQAMADTLRQKLGGKKFLLVLDDVWNEDRDLWEDLRKQVLCGAKGSKIIVTTRSNEVANIMGTLPAHRLQALSDDESWLLFKQRAFGVSQGRRAEETQELVAIGKKIIEKCKGVPLAVKAIGGMLSSKRGTGEWESILNSELWDLPEDKIKILPALRLSYDHLPSHLKQCFSFCSIFLKDEEIEVERLIQLWMAEGLLQTVQKKNMEMEDVGYEYFQELLSKSFFQLLDENQVEGPGDKIDYCVMHDLFHDLAQLISRSECCVFYTKRENDISKMQHVRRLRLELPLEEETTEIPKELGMAKKLRVLFIQGYGRSKIGNVSLLMSSKSLRVLSLCRFWNEELADMIAKLKHLRYFEIRGFYGKYLGSTTCITRLYHLQTIIFPPEFYPELPRIENLINLRHLDTAYGAFLMSAKLPKGFGKLRLLQKLALYRIGKEKGSRIEELKKLDQIRGKLSVSRLENVKSREEAMNANLKQKRLISTLHLCWSENRENNYNYDEEVLEGLEPHPDLKELNIEEFMGVRLPGWLTHQMLPNLVSVSLQFASKCECEYLPAFGLFASLQSLEICGMNPLKCIGIEFYRGIVAHSPPPSFPCLKTLKLGWLQNLEKWVELPTSSSSSPSSSLLSSIPSLENLHICGCPKLRTMPTFFPSIRRLQLLYNDSVVEMMLGKCEDDDEEENSNNIQELISTFSTNLRELQLSHNTFPSLPKCIQCFTALEFLVITNFPNMEALPEWLGNLTSLQRLYINDCERLMYMPSAEAMRRLCKLASLEYSYCPRLSERCTRDQGEEWCKISHIPTIGILP